MARYDAEIDLTNRNTSHTQIVELVGSKKRVLDVGCATGYLARTLVARGNQVWGLDNDQELAEPARDTVESLVIADLENSLLTDHYDKESFDVVVFGDVLEHVNDPEGVLRDSLSLLAEGGRVIVSIPNVTHGSVRLALLEGRWRYTDTGLLDSTHVRFFDRQAVGELFRSVGMTVEVLWGTTADPLRTEVGVDGTDLPPAVVEWVREQPDALVYQFVASARVAEAGDSLALPDLELPVPPDEVRLTDDYTHRYIGALQTMQHRENVITLREAENAELRHAVMTQRDHIIGLEATAASASMRAREANRRVQRLRASVQRLKKEKARSARQARRLREEAKRLQEESRALTRSRSWRVGRALTSPARVFRRGS
ncbi:MULTISPECIES: methyltransferase domain-containing protein [unclassified Nocardioides]|uniref:methyltransferase domain-containing protein n=1 Tax=unclassified Nocardioides TaxID=2615069 RepID=UPI00360D1CD0